MRKSLHKLQESDRVFAISVVWVVKLQIVDRFLGINLEIYKIFEEKGAGLTLNLQTSALYDKSVNSILKAYDIEIPVEQLSGKTDGKLSLDIKFDPLDVTAKGKFKINGGQTLIAGAKFNVGTADVELHTYTIIIVSST